MKLIHKALVSIVSIAIVAIIIIVALGYTGIISVPGMSPSIQSYDGGTEIDYATVQEFLGSMQDVPSLSELQGTGLTIHFYGTNQHASVVTSFYALQLGWDLDYDTSGPGWTFKIWRNIAYGFGLSTMENAMVKARTGYNTVYMTADGPASAWLGVIEQFSH